MSIQANLTLNGLTVTNASNQFNLTDQGFTYNNASTTWTTILTNVQSLETVEANTSILNASLLAEISRATTAESTLNTSFLAEITRATTVENQLNASLLEVSAVDTQLNASILAEITRASTAESVLNTSLLAEITRASTSESTLNTSLLAEITRAMTVENQLNASLLSTKTYLDTTIFQDIQEKTNTWTSKQTFNQPLGIGFTPSSLANASTSIGYSVYSDISGSITTNPDYKGTITGLRVGRWVINFVCSYNPSSTEQGFSYSVCNASGIIGQPFYQYTPAVSNYGSMTGTILYDIETGPEDISFRVNNTSGTTAILNGEIRAIRIA